MKMKLIAAAALVVGFAMPAFAASEFYLVQELGNEKVLNRGGQTHGQHNGSSWRRS